MSDQISLGTFRLKCPACGGQKFAGPDDVKSKPESVVTCGDCGHTLTAEALIEHNKAAATEAAADIVRKAFKLK